MKKARVALWVKFAAMSIPVVTCISLFTAYRFGEPEILSPIFERRVAAPNEEEYRVLSAFVNDFWGRLPYPTQLPDEKPKAILVSDTTIPMRNASSLDVAVLGAESAESDFFRQNAQPWTLQVEGFHGFSEVQLVGSSAIAEPELHLRTGIVHFSRVGFNKSRSIALLYFSFHCGNMCAQSGLVVLKKTGSTWHIQQFGPTVVS
jgi:hypothetical protein